MMRTWFSLARWRWAIMLGSLVVNLYFLFAAWTFPDSLPEIGIARHAQPGAVLVVSVVPDSLAARSLHTGDLLIAINNWPLANNVDWRWFFHAAQQTLTVQRGSQQFIITLESQPVPFELVRLRSVPHFVALLLWAAGAMILAFAHSRQTWRAGYVIVGAAVGLAALSGNQYFIPGGRTGSEVLLPIICAGFVELALYPKATNYSRTERLALDALYGGAVLLSLSAVIEIFVLAPLGLSPLYSSYRVLRLWIGVCLVANPLIIAARYLRAPRSPVKQQLRILLVLTLLAVLPLIVLVILPDVLLPPQTLETVQTTFLEFSLGMLALIPLAYAYVIYRHKFLGLDVFFTRSLALLLLGFLLLVGYGAFYTLLHRSPSLADLEPLPSALFVVVAFIGAPAANAKTRQAAQRLLYGQREAAERVWANLAAELTRSPELSTLCRAVQEVADLLEVRQAALWLPDGQGDYQVAHTLRVENMVPIGRAEVLHHLPAALVTRTSAEAGELQSAAPVNTPQPLLAQYVWVEVLLPLLVGSETVGLLALGPRVPDGPLNAFQLGFAKRAGSLLAMAAHTTRLFDQVRAQSRAMMELRASERRQLARELHDDPLQAVASFAIRSGTLASQLTAAGLPTPAADAQQMALDARATTKVLRAICEGLRPPVLEQGLGAVVLDAVWRFQRTQPEIEVEREIASTLPPVDMQTAEAVLHIITESLTNISKHAQAKQVWVQLQPQADHLELQVADDGAGFPHTHWSLAALARQGHFGLVGMQEWAAIARGQLQFAPRTGGGTVLTLRVPVSAN